MLTRLEVDGFKNLVDFSVDFGPFTCIAGPNGVGKSNIFDAIRFLALLADHPLMEAALRVRTNGAEVNEMAETTDVRDLFHRSGSRRDSFRIAAEMIVEPHVRDDLGAGASVSSTYLRYEIRVAYRPPSKSTLGGIVLEWEDLKQIPKREAVARLRFPTEEPFRQAITSGRLRGPRIAAPAEAALRTAVGASSTVATPTSLAARREMQGWYVLSLEPAAMRSPDRFHAPPHITSSGGHLPATVYRLAREAEEVDGDPDAVYASIAAKLARLVPISGVRVDKDDARQLLTLQVQERSGAWLPAASLSDGTLRFLTLAALTEDSQGRGLICLEEPENGIHPAKMYDMTELLKELAVDPRLAPGGFNPLRQVIAATHSPAFVQLQNPDDLLFALQAAVREENGKPVSTLRCRPLRNTWRSRGGEPSVDFATIIAYLSAPPEAQLELPPIAALA